MNQAILADAGSTLAKVARTAGMILAACLVAAMMIGWLGLLLWLGGEGIIALMRWL